MIQLDIIVPTVPVAQPRQRHRVITVKGKAMATNYTPKNDPVNTYKAAVQAAVARVHSGPPLEGPIWCSLDFVMPRPKRLVWKRKPMPRLPCITKPDRDNLEKSTCDALNNLLWRDDSQVYSGPVNKWIAAGDELPHVRIYIQQHRMEGVLSVWGF